MRVTLFLLGITVLISTTACHRKAEIKQTADQSTTAPKGLGKDIPTFKQPIDKLVYMLTGTFSNDDQENSDPDFYHITLRQYPIWKERTDAKWFYVEQSVSSMQDKPYRQRVYRVHQLRNGTLESAAYTFPNPEKHVGDWKKAEPLADITPDMLKIRDGCEVTLKLEDEKTFKGSTKGNDCKSELKGSTYATSEVTISFTYMSTWDRGYDAKGKQVWGSTKGPYIYNKIK